MFEITKHLLGCIKSPFDKRDYLLWSFVKTLKLPKKLDLTDKMTPVRSQGQEGSCVGFAMATGVKEYQEQIDYDRFIELSPRYIYEEAKKVSGHEEGTTLKAAVEVAKTKGLCEEGFWPYEANIVGQRASEADKNASKYKIKAYARILNLDELKQALVQFGVVLVGIYVYKSMKDVDSDGLVPDPSCWERMDVLGGHAIAVCGYDDTEQLVKFKNSWGDDWGEKGFGYFSYKYAKKNIMDAYSMVDILDPNPYRLENLTVEEGKRAWV